jgi:hypothetical protein
LGDARTARSSVRRASQRSSPWVEVVYELGEIAVAGGDIRAARVFGPDRLAA